MSFGSGRLAYGYRNQDLGVAGDRPTGQTHSHHGDRDIVDDHPSDSCTGLQRHLRSRASETRLRCARRSLAPICTPSARVMVTPLTELIVSGIYERFGAKLLVRVSVSPTRSSPQCPAGGL
jgi:hypothetical protein